MVLELIHEQQKTNPSLLFAYGKIEETKLANELQKINYKFPNELIGFWKEFGGGDLFETETILSPFPIANEFIYDIQTINQFHYSIGLDKNYIIFQENGSQMTAFDKQTNALVVLSKEDYSIENKFDNFENWFDYFWKVNS